MKYIKMGIIIMLIVSIILVSIILVILLMEKEKQENDLSQNIVDEYSIVPDTNILIMENEDVFFSIEQAVKYYINYNIDRNQKALYNIFDKKFINNNGITENNVIEKIDLFPNDKDIEFNAEKIYTTDITTDIIASFVYGNLKELTTTQNYSDKTQSEEIYLTVIVDFENETFSVFPIPCEYRSNTNDEEISKIEKYLSKYSIDTDSIADNSYNKFNMISVNEAQIANKYFLLMKDNLKNNTDKLYNSLDEEYRKKRFYIKEEYETYINNRKDSILLARLDKYKKTVKDGYNEYICIDSNGNYYIFRETSIMNYTVLLDTYTINTQEFNEQYEKATNQKKVAMNIGKFFDMINAKDYKAAYAVLDDDFKNNYFKTESDFENYIKQKLFLYNDVEYSSFDDNIASVFKYNLRVKNRLDKTQEIDFSIIMQLKEGKNFVMSFSI